jgi:hypothetical protein
MTLCSTAHEKHPGFGTLISPVLPPNDMGSPTLQTLTAMELVMRLWRTLVHPDQKKNIELRDLDPKRYLCFKDLGFTKMFQKKRKKNRNTNTA